MQNKSIIVVIGFLVIIVGAVAYSVRTTAPDHQGMMNMSKQMGTHGDVPAGMHRMPDGSLMSNGSDTTGMGMMGGMDHSMMMVKSEREFLEGMIPHHQEAVDTAKEVLARGGSTPEIKKLAEDIIVAQEKEIALMKTWYQDWYGEAYVAKADAYTPMMRDLQNLQGAALDTVFLEDMIPHHQGAIMMAQSVKPHIEHQEITDLTTAITETQVAEIKLMQELLETL